MPPQFQIADPAGSAQVTLLTFQKIRRRAFSISIASPDCESRLRSVRRRPSAPTKGSSGEDCRGAIPGRHRNDKCRLLESFVPPCDQQLPLSRISSSNAQGDRFNQHEQEINDVRVLSTFY